MANYYNVQINTMVSAVRCLVNDQSVFVQLLKVVLSLGFDCCSVFEETALTLYSHNVRSAKNHQIIIISYACINIKVYGVKSCRNICSSL